MLTASQKDKIVDLTDYIDRIAGNLHHTHWQQVPVEDIAQEMVLYIAERVEADPAFLNQSPGYVTKAAAWAARHWCRDRFTRYLHGERVGKDVSLETEADNELPADEVYAAPEVDGDIAIDVHEALAGLDEAARRVAEMRLAGWRRCDIAAEMGTSSQNLQQFYRRIETALAPIAAAMAA